MSKLRKKNLKVGQKVRLVDNRDKMDGNIAMGWCDSMERHFGTVVTIEEIDTDNRRGLGYIRTEENGWSWDLRFLEALDEKPVSKVYNRIDCIDYFDDEDFILPCDYSLKKVIENGKAVICFVEEDNTGKMIKTVAICQEGDAFDLHKGVQICMYKTLRKIAEKNLKKF